MSDKVLIIYDCPKEQCDKIWLKEELEKRGYCVKTVFCLYRISNIEQRGTIGKLFSRMLTLWQSIKGIIKSGKDETVICWSQWSGLFFNMLPGAKERYIISYNWLTPVPNSNTRFLYTKALRNPRLTAIINSKETKERILNDYKAEDTGNIVYIQDVFDDKEEFLCPSYNMEKKYCFSGGRANRDWKLLIEIARLCPNVLFRIAAPKSGWDNSLQIPENVELYFDVEPEKYYALLKDSYMSVYPLKENRVSGLINILKSMQMGKLVLTTDCAFTEMYFPEESSDYLLDSQDAKRWKNKVEELWNYNEEKYCFRVEGMQEHIREYFSPHMAGEKIDTIIRGRK